MQDLDGDGWNLELAPQLALGLAPIIRKNLWLPHLSCRWPVRSDCVTLRLGFGGMSTLSNKMEVTGSFYVWTCRKRQHLIGYLKLYSQSISSCQLIRCLFPCFRSMLFGHCPLYLSQACNPVIIQGMGISWQGGRQLQTVKTARSPEWVHPQDLRGECKQTVGDATSL